MRYNSSLNLYMLIYLSENLIKENYDLYKTEVNYNLSENLIKENYDIQNWSEL